MIGWLLVGTGRWWRVVVGSVFGQVSLVKSVDGGGARVYRVRLLKVC